MVKDIECLMDCGSTGKDGALSRSANLMMMLFFVISSSSLLPSPTRREVLSTATLASIAPPIPALAAAAYPSSVTLSNGATFPFASFGLQIYSDDMAEKLTLLALEAGFRNFFASVLARNQV